MIKAIFWDNDGVLVDTEKLYYRANKEIFSNMGISLTEQIYIGIVTSSKREHFEIIHSGTGLLKYFDFTLTSDDFRTPKPDPEPYLKALEKTGFKKEECIVVEDSQRGLTAALKAELKCYVIPTELTGSSNFNGAEKILSSVSDLPELLLD